MTKSSMHIAFLLAVVAACLYFIFFGPSGLIKYYQTAQEIKHERDKIVKLEQQNKHLVDKIKRWNKDDFEKEKFARQDLQMSRPDEMVFVTTQT